uniref:GNAT family N-acetyltransferase n=1 Tax=Flavobacterium sp. TaxID=239 RepID=UPI00404875F2
MNLVKVTISDLPIIIDLTKKIWPVAYGEILSKSQLDYMIDKFYNETALREQIEGKGHIFYLAQDYEDNYVGFVSYEINCEPHKTKIHKIYVLPETQGTGLGRQFFELVKEQINYV